MKEPGREIDLNDLGGPQPELAEIRELAQRLLTPCRSPL